jgi:DNA-binding SARP family transcriptional activator
VDINILNSPSGTVLRLTTLGQLTIAGDSEETASLGRQRRKLAVLVVLALSGRPRSRDSLADMFWGDQDAEHARHSLSEALSHIRRALGRDAVATRLTDISLSTKAPLFVDAVEFERRVRTGELAGAIDLYEGAFLDGVHVEGSAAFDQWMDERRAYYERLFVKAASQYCETLARSRQWDACASVAARWLALTPLSPDAALYLLNARKAVGSRDALERATAEFQQLRARLRREYDTGPDPVVVELAQSIGDALERLAPVAVVPSSIPAQASEGGGDRAARAETVPAPSERVAASPASPRRRRITAALAVLAVLLAGVSLTVATRSRKTDTERPTRIAVVPFTHIGGDSATAYFTHGMTEEVSVALGAVDGVRVLPVSS